MHDDTVTTSWRRLTAFAGTSSALPQTTCGAVALENLPVAPAAIPHAGLVSLTEGAASSSSPAHAATATAGCRTDRDGEAIQQTARLATWEDEGGTTSS
jgi:hypothetical protein